MEQTLGKRIMMHRKRLGMTQDALAERLGITAQAVSKWENDLSCPDISMLPKLAEIFSITTDELLGAEPKDKVYEAEVMGKEEAQDSGLHVEGKGDKWEFRWNAGLRGRLFFPLWVLLLGVLLLVDNILSLDVGFWRLAWPSWLLMMGLFSSKRFSLTCLGFTLVGGYFLAEHLNIIPFELTGQIIWPAMVILFGLTLLIDTLHKPKKPQFVIHKQGNNSEKTKWECHNHTGGFECDLSFGERSFRVDVPELSGGEANVSFGELTVDLRSIGSVSDDCHIEANCSFGELNLLVPRRFAVQSDNSTAFASINFIGHPDSNPEGVIHLDANASFGEIVVRYT